MKDWNINTNDFYERGVKTLIKLKNFTAIKPPRFETLRQYGRMFMHWWVNEQIHYVTNDVNPPPVKLSTPSCFYFPRCLSAIIHESETHVPESAPTRESLGLPTG